MKADIKQFVAECETCQRQKGETVASPGLLQPLAVPEEVWTDISMDFIDGLPPSQGKTTILVVVDRLTKYAHFCPLAHPYTAIIVAQVFVDNIVKLHGIPQSIVSDRDKVFTSNFWKELFRLQGTQLRMSTAYHPQTDGQTEVVNRCLENYLRCFVGDKPKEWTRWLSWAEWWYNTTYHSAIKMTPFEAVYGRAPPIIPTYNARSSSVDELDRTLQDRTKVLRILKDHLHAAQARMKQQADKHRSEREFEVGDWVFLRLQPY
jgi:transposase InsO family protein